MFLFFLDLSLPHKLRVGKDPVYLAYYYIFCLTKCFFGKKNFAQNKSTMQIVCVCLCEIHSDRGRQGGRGEEEDKECDRKKWQEEGKDLQTTSITLRKGKRTERKECPGHHRGDQEMVPVNTFGDKLEGSAPTCSCVSLREVCRDRVHVTPLQSPHVGREGFSSE